MNDALSLIVVDDEPNVLAGLRRGLTALRPAWRPEFYDDPYAALARIRAGGVDVVVTDQHMPELTGLELMAAARPHAPGAGFLVLTGAGDYDLALAAINDHHVDKFLTKPCSADLLAEAIDAVASARAAAGAADAPARLARAALELFATAVIVIDPTTSDVVYANAEGARLIADRAGAFVRDARGALRARTSDATHQLTECVDAAATRGVAFLSLPTRDADAGCCVAARALGDFRDGAPLVALLVTDPHATTAPSPEAIIALFELTRAEALVAAALADGLDVAQAAESCGVTIETARTYLKRAYAKTGARGQRDLVKLILSTPRLSKPGASASDRSAPGQAATA